MKSKCFEMSTASHVKMKTSIKEKKIFMKNEKQLSVILDRGRMLTRSLWDL